MKMSSEIDISIITIAFNGYGKYISRWLDSVLSQTIKPREAIIVLSKNHKLDIKEDDAINKGKESGVDVRFVHEERRILSMGMLRNKGIEKISTEWLLYFSVDDILLDNAVCEIKKASKGIDIVALKYFQEQNGKRWIVETPIPETEKIKHWFQCYCNSGYVAFRKSVWEKLKYIDSDYPNFPFLFDAFYDGMKFEKTKNPCAVYLQRPEGHGSKRSGKQNNEAYAIINNFVR